MIGYIKPDVDEFKVRELKLYNAYYCGICTLLAKRYGPLSRLILSYDATFFAIMNDAFSKEERKFSKSRCPLPPFQKKNIIDSSSVEFGTVISKFGLDLKIDDIKRDSKGIKHALSFMLIHFRMDEELFHKSKPYLDRILFSELTENTDPYEVADNFGKFSQNLAYFSKNLSIASMMMYLIGRWVYLIDALDDLEKDSKVKNYNPFLLKYAHLKPNGDFFQKIRSNEQNSMDFLMKRIQEEFSEIDGQMTRNQNLIENVIFYGMPKVTEKIMNKKGEKK